MALTDYGGEYILTKVFENTDTFYIALFTAGTPDDSPVLEEVEDADYDREPIQGSSCGAFEYQNTAGTTTSQSDTPGQGIPAYRFVTATDTLPISWEFAGPLSGTNKDIIGYAILKPTAGANPFAATDVIDAKLFAVPFTPANDGDTLVIESISVRLSAGTVS